MPEINKDLLLSRILHSGDFTALEKRYLENLVGADENPTSSNKDYNKGGHWIPEVSPVPRKGWQCSSCLAMTETAHYCYQCYFDYCPKCGTKLRLRMEVNNGNSK